MKIAHNVEADLTTLQYTFVMSIGRKPIVICQVVSFKIVSEFNFACCPASYYFQITYLFLIYEVKISNLGLRNERSFLHLIQFYTPSSRSK